MPKENYPFTNVDFPFIETTNFNKQKVKCVIGDFNSHSAAWGHLEDDNKLMPF